MRILSLQPYYGGSHKAFIDGWLGNSRHEWIQLVLPARHWKWRMRHSAIEFAQRLAQPEYCKREFDAILCTDMLNLAEFKGLVSRPFSDTKTVVYFHENQFEYPDRQALERDLHFAFTNLTTVLAANKVWFNSRFNFESMMAGLQNQLEHWPDYAPRFLMEDLETKSSIQPPGIESLGRASSFKRSTPLHLIWAARWEHDKNPAALLETLNLLKQKRIEFQISVLGQSYRQVPVEFKTIKKRFADQIVNWGFLESREDYWSAMGQGDVFLSTADHEFFGIAAAEAIAAGLFPLLPDRLAYPELLDRVSKDKSSYLYDGTPQDLARRIENLNSKSTKEWTRFESENLPQKCAQCFGWQQRSRELDDAIEDAVEI